MSEQDYRDDEAVALYDDGGWIAYLCGTCANGIGEWANYEMPSDRIEHAAALVDEGVKLGWPVAAERLWVQKQLAGTAACEYCGRSLAECAAETLAGEPETPAGEPETPAGELETPAEEADTVWVRLARASKPEWWVRLEVATAVPPSVRAAMEDALSELLQREA